jgi:hypothetical protein
MESNLVYVHQELRPETTAFFQEWVDVTESHSKAVIDAEVRDQQALNLLGDVTHRAAIRFR